MRGEGKTRVKIAQILDKIDSRELVLPEFQRGYVWNRDQVRGFFQSLYRGYPIGSFLTWSTRAETATTRGGPVERDGAVQLLLDGQQRITTLYGVVRGRPPRFFEGNPATFTGLRFHLDEEAFEFYAPVKMKDDPAWVDVTALFQRGIGAYFSAIVQLAGADRERLETLHNRLNRLHQIPEREVHVEEVTGEDKTVEVVVDIFNRVNSGGTKLSHGDLALAAVCSRWPEARQEMNAALERWRQAGFEFKLDWLLRTLNAVVTGEANFTALAEIPAGQLREGLAETVGTVGHLLDVVSSRLGLDHDRVLAGRLAFPVMARFLHNRSGRFANAAERDRLLHWYIHAFLWGRYSGATETALNQDLEAVDRGDVDQLLDQLRLLRADLTIRPDDFGGSQLGARFYPLLYLLTRVCGARDLGSGLPLSAHMLGRLSSLQVHHIFPKSKLYERGYRKAEVNAIANFCFLTQDSNLQIGDRDPRDYLARLEEAHPGVLASQWIPTDPDLWRLDRYRDFLAARRELLAAAANDFLASLLGTSEEEPVTEPDAPRTPVTVTVAEPDDDADAVDSLVEWLVGQGMAKPERNAEVADPENGRVLTVAAAFWPNGLQEGLGDPVVLLPDPDDTDQPGLAASGFLVFHQADALRAYVDKRRKVQADAPAPTRPRGWDRAAFEDYVAAHCPPEIRDAVTSLIGHAERHGARFIPGRGKKPSLKAEFPVDGKWQRTWVLWVPVSGPDDTSLTLSLGSIAAAVPWNKLTRLVGALQTVPLLAAPLAAARAVGYQKWPSFRLAELTSAEGWLEQLETALEELVHG